jgi:hypothetical protein
LPSDLTTAFVGFQASINELLTEVASLRAELRARPSQGTVPSRKWYTVEEAAVSLGKRRYTVREWCRHGQNNAAKRAERRGCAALWTISAEEIERYKNEGLLKAALNRNNSN